jgi:hypothetical protein
VEDTHEPFSMLDPVHVWVGSIQPSPRPISDDGNVQTLLTSPRHPDSAKDETFPVLVDREHAMPWESEYPRDMSSVRPHPQVGHPSTVPDIQLEQVSIPGATPDITAIIGSIALRAKRSRRQSLSCCARIERGWLMAGSIAAWRTHVETPSR